MSWFEKIMPSRIKTERRTRSVPEGLWIKCPACDAVLYRAELERNLYVCPKCSHHMRMGARERLERFLDPGTIEEIGAAIAPEDPLKFRDSKRYRDRLAQAQKATGESDALIVLTGTLHALPIVACAFEFQFLGGSMGSVVGERFKRGTDYCIQERRPFVCFSASGGARMQEALYSLLQMAKTAAALSALAQAHLPFISVMTDPTTALPTSENYGIDAQFNLIDIASNKSVMTGTTFSRVSYDMPGSYQRFARARAMRDAEDRASQEIAEKIQTRLASFFVAGT